MCCHTVHNKVVWWIAGKDKYAKTPDNAIGYMFAFKIRETPYWVDTTAETPTAGRLINHSRCRPNVSKVYIHVLITPGVFEISCDILAYHILLIFIRTVCVIFN